MNCTTAVIYFSRSAAEEIKQKVFCRSNAKLNRAIASELYDHTLQQIFKTGLPFFCYTQQKQEGNNFGEKLANAFQQVFAAGYESVIAVGSDSPGIEKAHILQAAQTLCNTPVVAGPTAQGGCYLLGMQKKAFNFQQFVGLAWQTEGLVGQMKTVFERIILLPIILEVNNEKHLDTLIKSAQKIKKNILRLICLINSYGNSQIFSYQTSVVPNFCLLNKTLGRAP
ncbi:MAG: DUF2064 domain-containing protein [Gloeobacteraceae cyanobacterium ES-bin-316]|nr:DUF2064 domain-containing protein [Ferruginibacter sp.]